MAKDILLTEEEQQERIKEWWKKNAASLITGCVLGLGLVVGVNYWRDHQGRQAEAASEIFTRLMQNLSGEQSADAAEVAEWVASLKNDYSGTPYAGKAALIEAKTFVDQGELDKAADSLSWALKNSDEAGVQHAARLRLARVYLESERHGEAARLLEREDLGGFDSHYYELQGDVAFASGDATTARARYQQAVDSLEDGQSHARIIKMKQDALPPENSAEAPAEPPAGAPVEASEGDK